MNAGLAVGGWSLVGDWLLAGLTRRHRISLRRAVHHLELSRQPRCLPRNFRVDVDYTSIAASRIGISGVIIHDNSDLTPLAATRL